jgi:hypothetical protein
MSTASSTTGSTMCSLTTTRAQTAPFVSIDRTLTATASPMQLQSSASSLTDARASNWWRGQSGRHRVQQRLTRLPAASCACSLHVTRCLH